MDKQQLLAKVSSARDVKVIAETVFDYLKVKLNPKAAYFIADPREVPDAKPQYCYGTPTSTSLFPASFWTWASQFDTADNLLPLEINTCSWDYRTTLGGESYIMMFDNHPSFRTYLFLECVDPTLGQEWLYHQELDVMHFVASRWQCLRAERNAAIEFKNRDVREAKYLDQIRQRETFIDKLKLIQQVAVELSNPPSLDELYLKIVEVMRDKLGFDRSVFMLLDFKKRCFTGTYGTDEDGNTIAEHHTVYDIHQLESRYIDALYDQDKSLVIIEDAPLYTAGSVVGQGWNGMLILRDEKEPIGWVAFDNFINRRPITDYECEILKSFSSLLSQIYIRKRQEQNMRLLHSSMMELSRCSTVHDVCRSAVNFAINNLGVDRLAVFLTDSELSHWRGTWGTDIQGNVVDESYFRASVDDDTPLVANAIAHPNELSFEESVPIYHDQRIVGFGWSGMIMLKSNEGAIAFLAADNLLSRRPMTSLLQELILMFASNLAEVLQRTMAQEGLRNLNETLEIQVKNRTAELQLANRKLELLSVTDPLTRLGNRRQLDQRIELLKQLPKQVTGFGLILLDIDHFGLFNNHYGHLEGDIVLMRIGDMLDKFCSSDDEMFCRIGGEEFALVLSHTCVSKTRQLAKQLCSAIEAEKIAHSTSDASNYLTVSIGYVVVEVCPDELCFESLYRQADQALYQAKRAGRNQAIAFQQPLEATEETSVN
ncbi:GGDEF domain-containing protein [Vibrio sp. SCSIO 43136]|uniref:sensor domain-containing diguanylate cyclase n=1 Tax=Vibrio sp. SCSIO 43136 TaxID=2819101 RepID=UPI0020750808|nr:GGDEF domain-containing protein [Vibrio sp. SCSIO 43136]USD67169.1 GGDEF domain-containing protein [Vibrio sp. SCSIO 43136]